MEAKATEEIPETLAHGVEEALELSPEEPAEDANVGEISVHPQEGQSISDGVGEDTTNVSQLQSIVQFVVSEVDRRT